MERDLFRATESMLRNHEAAKLQLATLEQVTNGKNKDGPHRFLEVCVYAIDSAYKSLPRQLQQFITLYYFEGKSRVDVIRKMGISKRGFTRMRNKAVKKVSSFVAIIEGGTHNGTSI